MSTAGLARGLWGHRYDAALLIALLYPAWWVGRASKARQAIAIVVGVVGLVLIVIAGSRTVWVAVALAAAVALLPRSVAQFRPRPRAGISVAIGAVSVGGAAVAVGVAGPLIERLLSFASASWRIAMWEPLVGLWGEQPLPGVGPGAFLGVLQLTTHFDMNAHAPRHPDNALSQALPEAGLLGIAAILVGSLR